MAGLFSRRGFNIESLAVSITEDPTVSRMTIVVGGDERALEQISKQLNKLVEVIKVYDYTETPNVERELALMKVTAEPARRAEAEQRTVGRKRGKVEVKRETLEGRRGASEAKREAA